MVDRKPVVVKLAPLKSGLNWADFKLFEREATILKVLDHPRIPKYVDFLELDTPDYQGSVLVQEYIAARSIQTQVESGQPFTPEMVKEIAIQILEILNYLHTLNPPIIHRDIKPSNLLLSDRSAHHVGQIYLVDFGAAKTMTPSIGKTLTVVGSYGYAPLEQFGGRAVPASDLYSLGATIIYLLTGRHPAELPQVDLKIQFESKTNVSSGLKNWLTTATQPFLDRRFPNAEVALEALKNPITTDLSPTHSPPFGKSIESTESLTLKFRNTSGFSVENVHSSTSSRDRTSNRSIAFPPTKQVMNPILRMARSSDGPMFPARLNCGQTR